jgi:hypothetical protein
MRQQHLVHLLIRQRPDGDDGFFLHPRGDGLAPTGRPYLCLPAKRSVRDPLAPYLRGESLDHFVDAILQEDLGLAADDYVLEQELPCVTREMASPLHHEPTRYAVHPVDVWGSRALRARGLKSDGERLDPRRP